MFHDCDDCKHQAYATDYDKFACEFCDYDEGYEFGMDGPTGWAPKEEEETNGQTQKGE